MYQQTTNSIADDMLESSSTPIPEMTIVQEEATETEATETEETEMGEDGCDQTPETMAAPSSGRSLSKMNESSSVIEFDRSYSDDNNDATDPLFENFSEDSPVPSFDSGFSAKPSNTADSDDRRTKSPKKTSFQKKRMVRESAIVIDVDHGDDDDWMIRKSNGFTKPVRLAGIDYDSDVDVEDKKEEKAISESKTQMDTQEIDDQPLPSTREASLIIDYELSDSTPLFRNSNGFKPLCKSDIEDDIEDEDEDEYDDDDDYEDWLPNERSLTISHGGSGSSHRTTSSSSSGIRRNFSNQRNRNASFAMSNLGLTDRSKASKGRRAGYATNRKSDTNQEFRISKNPSKVSLERAEAYFYNHGMEIALGVLFLALNVLVAGHGVYQFSRIGGWTTDNDVLRVTLPIARAGGRLVTLNCSILLLTACKYLWTLVRTYITPVVPIGFPIDEVMPKYHRYVALVIIFGGCIVHTLPQIVNYASRSIVMDWSKPVRLWTFGDGFATKQLLITGILLTIIFTTFFLTTLARFRRTTAGFRWFWTFHMVGIATAYPLLIVHGTCFGRPVFLYAALAPLALYLFDVSMRRKNIFSVDILRWRVHNDDGQEITELVLELPEGFTYTPGQYAELKFNPISGREWHPFTIASSPTEKRGVGCADGSEKNEITFFIKNCGRWTGALADYASAFELSKARNPPQMFLRGPHGAPAMNYIEYKHIVVIGSGVGVTPLLSIWKYLVNKGAALGGSAPSMDRRIRIPAAMSLMNQSINIFKSDYSKSKEFDMDSSSSVNFLQEFSHSFQFISLGNSIDDSLDESAVTKVIGKFRLRCFSLARLLESMVVSLSLFIWFVLGGTATILFQLLGYYVAASAFGSLLLLVGFLIHISIVVIEIIAQGPKIYFRLFKCWLDCTIIVADCFALWKCTKGLVVAMQDDTVTPGNDLYFLFFGIVTTLQAIRVFHIFYVTLKVPASPASSKKKKKDEEIGSKRKRRSSIIISDKVEFCSVQGILINRKYSMMKFAARTLLPPILESGLLDVFRMEFYGTREKPKEKDDEEHTLVGNMMGSVGAHIDVVGSKFYKKRTVNNDFFCPGRPDWNLIFHRAISEAHVTNDEGESVGVFFCGSPAIAKDLQVEARRVTAHHQFAMKHLHGKGCKCKLIVHSENF